MAEKVKIHNPTFMEESFEHHAIQKELIIKKN
jgi:hypothetical protein